jgi:hypothetical protein
MAYSEELIQQVWEKARAMPDQDPEDWRQDECGAWLKRQALDNEKSEHGWIIVNTSPGGPDVLENLRPLHCGNTFDKGIGKAHCHVTADRTGVQPTAALDQPRNRTV